MPARPLPEGDIGIGPRLSHISPPGPSPAPLALLDAPPEASGAHVERPLSLVRTLPPMQQVSGEIVQLLEASLFQSNCGPCDRWRCLGGGRSLPSLAIDLLEPCLRRN